MHNRIVTIVLLCGILFGVVVPASLFVQAANVSSAVDTRRAQLQSKLTSIESQINTSQATLNTLRTQHNTLQREINILDTEIRRAQLQVRATEIVVQQLSGTIASRTQTISDLTHTLSKEQESLAQIMRQTQMLDGYSAVDVAFSSKNVSTFFEDLDAFASIKRALGKSFNTLNATRTKTEVQKKALQDQLVQKQQLKQIQLLEQRQIQRNEYRKKVLLDKTKGKEGAYQSLINSQKKTAAQIRAELFTLRGSAPIPFGRALVYAQEAQRATGVRPAVILGVLKQETDLGQNLGTGNWRKDMSPNRDQPVFVYITKVLGLDPNVMPVSRRPSYGWGGAMGPGQFIPSTWVCYGGFINVHTGDCSNSQHSLSWNSFWKGPWKYVASKDRVRKLTGGQSPSNPWNDRDAFMATAMLMADNGAGAGTYYSERLAALRYFAGWTHARNPAYSFYGDGVMRYAAQFQKEIDQLNGS
ncbi:MAG TPA: hypothetical protein ENI56_02175 [Candidatus Kaiserbacteria bacterium]|nr:hypothetical protein [Candidatus Kaiserbacteria bacterium]